MSEVIQTTINPSILASVRVMCNVDETDNGFDTQLIPLINSQLMLAFHQLGIGSNGFNITGESEEWADWLGEGESKLAAIKTWVGYSVLLMFDPPDNGTVLKSIQDTIAKMEWILASKSRLEGHSRRLYPTDYPEDED